MAILTGLTCTVTPNDFPVTGFLFGVEGPAAGDGTIPVRWQGENGVFSGDYTNAPFQSGVEYRFQGYHPENMPDEQLMRVTFDADGNPTTPTRWENLSDPINGGNGKPGIVPTWQEVTEQIGGNITDRDVLAKTYSASSMPAVGEADGVVGIKQAGTTGVFTFVQLTRAKLRDLVGITLDYLLTTYVATKNFVFSGDNSLIHITDGDELNPAGEPISPGFRGFIDRVGVGRTFSFFFGRFPSGTVGFSNGKSSVQLVDKSMTLDSDFVQTQGVLFSQQIQHPSLIPNTQPIIAVAVMQQNPVSNNYEQRHVPLSALNLGSGSGGSGGSVSDLVVKRICTYEEDIQLERQDFAITSAAQHNTPIEHLLHLYGDYILPIIQDTALTTELNVTVSFPDQDHFILQVPASLSDWRGYVTLFRRTTAPV